MSSDDAATPRPKALGPEPGRPPLLLTVRELAALMGRTEKSVRHRIERGQLPGVTRIGGSVYFRRDEVLRFLSEGRGPSARSR